MSFILRIILLYTQLELFLLANVLLVLSIAVKRDLGEPELDKHQHTPGTRRLVLCHRVTFPVTLEYYLGV
jgi:hypothetical protein